jgi:hypothetical protein
VEPVLGIGLLLAVEERLDLAVDMPQLIREYLEHLHDDAGI